MLVQNKAVYVMLGHVSSGYVRWRYVKPGYTRVCQVRSV